MKLTKSPAGVLLAGFSAHTARLLRLTAILAALALFIGACGGDDDDSSSASAGDPSPTPAASTNGSTGPGAPTGAAATTGSGGPGASSSGSAGGGGVSPADLADVTGLDSFRWDITLSGAGSFLANAGVPSVPGSNNSDFTASGSYIAPDQAQVTINAAGLQYKQTIKGNQQWTTIAGVTTGPVPATSDAASLIYVSSFVDPNSVVSGQSMDCGGSENVNGVSAVRCETTEEINQQIVAGFGGGDIQTSDASFVLWVAQDGNYIVRWEFMAEGTSGGQPFEWNFVSNITDVNNVSSIEP